MCWMSQGITYFKVCFLVLVSEFYLILFIYLFFPHKHYPLCHVYYSICHVYYSRPKPKKNRNLLREWNKINGLFYIVKWSRCLFVLKFSGKYGLIIKLSTRRAKDLHWKIYHHIWTMGYWKLFHISKVSELSRWRAFYIGCQKCGLATVVIEHHIHM